ncbi:MAG: cobalamin B12-binding domain-containing protein [Deltaproteobacteria bacterium]|nr:cobalamin B12-binding domain-containing protein [Deltaproteobacteria bacterium]
MKMLLISANREKSPYPVSPIGLAYVAQALLSDGHDARVLDLCFAEDIAESIDAAVVASRPDVIGLSIRNVDNLTYPKTTSYLPYLLTVARKLREFGIPVVAGGSGFSLFPEEMLRHLGLEYGITGEGEGAMTEFARRLCAGWDVLSTPNLAYIKDGSFRQNPIGTVGAFASPARGLLDNERYFRDGGMANIQTKRGCPFSCVYCTYPLIDGSRIRCREAASVVDEMQEMLEGRGIDHFFFVDDIFNHPARQAAGICNAIIRRGLSVKWTCFATPLGMTPELLGLMKEAGCMGVEFGTDAASAKMLTAMGKSFTKDDIRRVSAQCAEAWLPAAHYLILGGPGETDETVAEAFAFMDEIDPRAVIAMIGVRVYPRTPMERISVAGGMIKEGANLLQSHFYVSPLIGVERLLSMISAHAALRPNWLVPAMDVRGRDETMTMLRKLGYRGPLWDMLGVAKSKAANR